MASSKKNLNDEQKRKLVVFYKENPSLWDSNNPYHSYISNWEFYNQMEFTDVTCDVDESVSSLEDDSSKQGEPPKKK